MDPASAEAIHPNNLRRIIRALEFWYLTGKKISEHNENERRKTSPYNFAYFVLDDDRQEIYRKIDRRVDLMLQNGLVEEVKALKELGCHRDMVSMQGLGYRQILDYLSGEMTLDEAVRVIKRDTRHFAKRQLTWFARERDVIRLERGSRNEDQLLEEILGILSEKGIF